MTDNEKRQNPRINSHNLISYICLDENNKPIRQGMGRTLNISEGGILLETHSPIESQYILSFTISLEDETMAIKGKVTHNEKRNDGTFECGIKFIEMDESKMRILKQVILMFRDEDKMSIKERITKLAREAEVYRTQGLFNQSREKYLKLLKLVKEDELTSKYKKLINDIKDRIKTLDNEITEIEQEPDIPDLPKDVQNLISNLFSFSEDQATAAIEGAVALAKFGQYEGAVKEFERLIKDGTLPRQAAMNLLRCHLSLASPDAAISQYEQWASEEELSKGDMRHLRSFLKDQLKAKGLDPRLPKLAEDVTEEKELEEKSEGPIELSAIGIKFTDGPLEGKTHEFEVFFQSGNTISIVIPSKDKSLVGTFNKGIRFSNIQCRSPMAIFNGSGLVSGKAHISNGPKQGSYAIDIKLDGQ